MTAKTGKKKGWGIRKYFRKTARKIASATSRFVSKRYAPKSGLNVSQIASDVVALKNLINVEKKRYVYSPNTQASLGQLFGNANGYLCEDITPVMGVGAGYSQRNGASIKLTGMYMKMQLYHLANASQPIKCRFMLFHVAGQPISPVSAEITKYLNPNVWLAQYNVGTSIYDYNSLKNPDYMGQVRLMKTKTFTVSKDSLSGQIVVKDVIIKMKLNHHVRFDADTTNVTGGQWFYCIVADCGNIHNASASTLIGLPTTQVSSGLAVNRTATFYYVDN